MIENDVRSGRRRELMKRLIERRVPAGGAVSTIGVVRGPGPVPLSSSQRQMWLHSRLAGDLPLYNEPFTIHRNGPLDPACLTRSLNEVIRRHEILRTVFPTVNGEPVQLVQPKLEIEVEFGQAASEAEALEMATADALLPFDLTTGPLIRARVVRLGDEIYRIFLTLHHIIFDGVSIYHVLLPELAAIYAAFSNGETSTLPPPQFQYADYTLWQREWMGEQGPAGQLDHWTNRLSGNRVRTAVATDHPRPEYPSFGGRLYPFLIERELAQGLKQLARECGASLYMVLLAAFNLLLYRCTGQAEIVLGTVTAGRNRPEFAKTFGFFLNPLVLRFEVGESCVFRDLVAQVRRVVLAALDNSEVPFEFLARSLDPKREPGRNPFFDILFSLEPPAGKPPEGWDLTQTRVDTGLSKFDLSLEFDERVDGLDGRFVYNTGLFDLETIDRMCVDWISLLKSIVPDQAQPAHDVAAPVCVTGARDRRPLRSKSTAGPTETEQAIAAIWANLLDCEGPIAVEDSFFDLGGHSLLVARLQYCIEQRFGVQTDIRAFYSCPTIAQIAGLLENRVVAV